MVSLSYISSPSQTLLDVLAHLISVYYSPELVRVSSLLVDGYEVPSRALVLRYTDGEHSFVIIDVNKRGRVSCAALATTPYAMHCPL